MGRERLRLKRNVQYGALPYRIVDGRVEVMLVTSRGTGRWVIPKGWPMKGRKPHESAEREAYEEAGILGKVGEVPLGSFEYGKRLKPETVIACKVEVFPMEVERHLDRWPEKGQREGRWFPHLEAAAAVNEAELGNIIRWLPDLLDVGVSA